MHQMHFSTNQVSSVMLRPKKLEVQGTKWKLREPIKTKTENHKIEPIPSKDRAMHEGDNLSFLDEFKKTFFLTVQFKFVFLSKYLYLATGL
jgi:hypothetical protein